MYFYHQNLNDKITVLTLLARKDLPKYKWVKSTKVQDLDLKDLSHKANPNGISISDIHYKNLDDIFNNTVSDTYLRAFLYQVTKALVPDGYKVNKCNAFFIRTTGQIILNTPKHLYMINAYDGPRTGEVREFKRDKKTLSQLYVNELREIGHRPIGRYSKAIDDLQSFWVAQSMKYHFNTIKAPGRVKLPQSFEKLFKELLVDINHYNSSKTGSFNLTYQDIVNFYWEIHNKKLTKKTRNVQEWLFSQRSLSKDNKAHKILKLLRFRPNYKNVTKGIKQVSLKSISPIVKQIKKDHVLKNYGFSLKYAYKLNYKQPQVKGKKHFIGVHGTNSFSIPTILMDGLKTHNELVKSGAKNFEDMGQALGDGVYLAQLPQCTKSLNFSNNSSSHYKFLIVADVAYSVPAHESGYFGAPNKKGYDLVFGDKVGYAHGYDEYVARHGKQIKLKYILVFKNDQANDKAA